MIVYASIFTGLMSFGLLACMFFKSCVLGIALNVFISFRKNTKWGFSYLPFNSFKGGRNKEIERRNTGIVGCCNGWIHVLSLPYYWIKGKAISING